MSADIKAWIVYDETVEWLDRYPDRVDDPPFARLHECCIPLTDYGAFTTNKDYRFYAAISGVRSLPDDPEPLFERRGLPPNIGGWCEGLIDDVTEVNDSNLSWLTLSEIRQALVHMDVGPEQISTEVEIVLDFMQLLEKRFGVDRVRLIFLVE